MGSTDLKYICETTIHPAEITKLNQNIICNYLVLSVPEQFMVCS